MNTQLGKNFIVTLMAVVLALGGFTWLSERTRSKDAPQVAAMNEASQQSPAASSTANQLHAGVATYPISDTAQANRNTAQTDTTDSAKPGYDEGYRVGYQDGERDCQQAHSALRASARRSSGYYSTRHYYAGRSYRRSGVAGVAYAAPRRDHSTRNMILTVAAPAALAAGIGGIAGGGKGAGIGALLGGGGGALYYLLKHRR